jgi:hypothetical protein
MRSGVASTEKEIMARFNNPLNHVRVAAPCPADWDQMIGSERMRFCGQCSLNVYNLSSMTRSEAESLIARNEGRLCVRFYRRRDGSIITEDCPVGLRAISRRVFYVAKAIGSMVLGVFAGLGVHEAYSNIASFRGERRMGVMAIRVNQLEADPPKVDERVPLATVGKMIVKRPNYTPRRPGAPGRER